MTAAARTAGGKPGPLLPRDEAHDRGLLFVVAVLCFLACLTAIGVSAADRAGRGWSRQLGGEATVIVRARSGETPDAAAARAAETLAGADGVVEARALEKEKAYDLVRPWLGDVADLDDLPVPRLVAVTLDPRHPATEATLRKALAAQGLDAVVDDHSLWIADIQRAARGVRWVGAAILLLILCATAAVIAFATRAGLAARRDVVEVLHLSGADDGYVAGLFQRRFGRMAATAGLAGAVIAAAAAAAARVAGGGAGLTPALPVAWTDLALVAPTPILAGAIAALVARATAMQLIRTLR